MNQQVNIERLRFNRIETVATLRGRKITSDFHFREPVDIHTYRRIVDAHFRAWPSPENHTMVEATIFPPNPYSLTLTRDQLNKS